MGWIESQLRCRDRSISLDVVKPGCDVSIFALIQLLLFVWIFLLLEKHLKFFPRVEQKKNIEIQAPFCVRDEEREGRERN
jgi:hypothetical protein